MWLVDEYKLTLRRLALRDDRYIDAVLSEPRANATLAGIDPRSHALLRVAALIAINAAPPSYMSAVEAGLDAGASHEEIVGTLIAVMPIVGVARVVSAAPNLGLALGYDVAEALELIERQLTGAPPLALLLPGHRHAEALLGRDEVVGVLGGGVEVDLHPPHRAGELAVLGP